MVQRHKPHIIMIIPRGEAVKNFLYSDTLKVLNENARVTLLSVIDDDKINKHFRHYVDQIIPLREYQENRALLYFRSIIYYAHYRWLWSGKAQTDWEWHDSTKKGIQKAKWIWMKTLARLLSQRPTLEFLTKAEQYLSWRLRPNNDFVELFQRLKPDLVFNTSHIHGVAGEIPAKISYHLGIPTVGFIFSWDNLTTRSRIFVPYHYYIVWHKGMRDLLLKIYPKIAEDRVFITGTPQFDFHFKSEYWLTREELCRRIGIDPARPFILYTTGMAHNFMGEHCMIELVIRLLNEMRLFPKPQLVVRTYVKDTSAEMKAMAARPRDGVVFPPIQWEEKWFTPLLEDLQTYTNLVRHAALGINAASTVSLELMMFDKPVINLGFDPPGVRLAHHDRFERHIEYDHYRPVAASGGVMVARSEHDMAEMLHRGLTEPQADSEMRQQFIKTTFGDTLDGNSGCRVAEVLLRLAERGTPK